MTVEVGDRVVYVGDDEEIGLGSSGKAWTLEGDRVEVNWGGGESGWYDLDTEIVSCNEASRRGIDPWA